MVLRAMNGLGSAYDLRLQEKMMKSWEAAKPGTVGT